MNNLKLTLTAALIWLITLTTFSQTTYTENASAYGLDIPHNKDGGHAWADYDDDGDPDILVNLRSTTIRNYLMRNNGDGTFTNVQATLAPGMVAGALAERQAAWGDLNNDGRNDFIMNTAGVSAPEAVALQIFLQNVDGSFGDGIGGTVPITVGKGPGVTLTINPINSEGAGLFDFEGDGDLDIFFDNHDYGIELLRNNYINHLTNTVVNPAPNALYSHATPLNGSPNVQLGLNQYATDGDFGTSADVNDDGWVDIFMRKRNQNDFFLNQGGTFTNGADLGQTENTNKGANGLWDLDNDGDMDAVWTENGQTQIHINDGPGIWTALLGTTSFPGLPQPGDFDFGTSTAGIDALAGGDIDNDGDIDILFVGDSRSYLFINQINSPTPAPGIIGSGAAMSFILDAQTFNVGVDGEGTTMIDIDDDGDLDIYMNINGGANQLYINNLAAANRVNHLLIDVTEDRDESGITGGPARTAIGTNIIIKDCLGNIISGLRQVNGVYGHGTQIPEEVHIGLPLGENETYLIEVHYPNLYNAATGGITRLLATAVAVPSDFPGTHHYSLTTTDAESLQNLNAPDAVDDFEFLPSSDFISMQFNLFDNDSDVDGDPFYIESIVQPALGSLVIDDANAGTVTFTYNVPGTPFTGTTFDYTISDARIPCFVLGKKDTAIAKLFIDPPASATIDFDGIDDHVSEETFMGGWPDATIMAWIKLDPTFSSNGDVAGQGLMRMYVNGTTKKLHSYYITSIGSSAYGSSSLTTLDMDQWYHVAISYEGSSGMTKIYLNGNLERSGSIPAGTLSSNPTYASPDFNIGRHSRVDNNYFKGAIDEVRVFNSVLTESQLQQMVYQEIEQDGLNIKGSTLDKGIIDVATTATVPWANLKAYYPMRTILAGKTVDASGNNRDATLKNIFSLQPQTAPMPYETTTDGPWTTEGTWLHGDVWDIEDIASNKDWSIVHVKNDVTTSASHTQLGMLIDSGNSLTVSGDNAITNNWYLQLDGTLDLADDSQLIQTENSDLVTSATGKIQRRQGGNSDFYWYNYWSSPVGTTGVTAFSDNNGTSNNTNNSPFNIAMLQNGTGIPMQFTSAFDEVGKISDRWLYSFQNGITYYDWVTLAPASDILPGVGYTQKGTGIDSNPDPMITEQQYTFVGKPNNGTILIPATDVPDAGNESEQDVTLTTTMIGNPYPSALDADQFIRDNIDFDNGGLNPIIQGTILLWEQWAGTTHWLSEYEGGYGFINLTETARAYQHQDIVIADPTNTDNRGIKTPTKFLPVGQAFFVEVVNDGNIEFNNGQRIFKQESLDESVFFRGAQSQDNTTNEDMTARDEEVTMVGPMQTIKLEFEVSNGATRQFVLGFSDITTDGFDPGYDGGLINQNPNEDMTSILDGKPYVIQAFSPISPEKKIDLYFNSSGNFTYILDIAELKNIDENQDIFVRDNRQNMYWNLTQDGAYHFSAFSGEDSERFDIVFNDNNSTLSGDSFILNEVLIYINNSENKLFVKGLEQPLKSLTLINMLGQTVKTFNNLDIYDLENGVSTGELSAGVYFVNLTTENNVKRNKKIILK